MKVRMKIQKRHKSKKQDEENLTCLTQNNKTGFQEKQRLCIVDGVSLPERRLLRFVLTQSGEVVPDIAGRLPGRGAWVEAKREKIDAAVKKGLFARAFRCKVEADVFLADSVADLLRKRVLSFLGLARRSGVLVCGYELVRASLKEGCPACCVEASDGADNGRIKILRLVRAVWGDVPLLGCFTAEVLGQALGREEMYHAVLRKSPLSERFLHEMERLEGFVELSPQNWQRMYT